MMKRKDAEDALLAKGVRWGVITFDDLNEIFPAEHFPVEEMERLIARLTAHGVKVVEHTAGRERARQHRQRQKN